MGFTKWSRLNRSISLSWDLCFGAIHREPSADRFASICYRNDDQLTASLPTTHTHTQTDTSRLKPRAGHRSPSRHRQRSHFALLIRLNVRANWRYFSGFNYYLICASNATLLLCFRRRRGSRWSMPPSRCLSGRAQFAWTTPSFENGYKGIASAVAFPEPELVWWFPKLNPTLSSSLQLMLQAVVGKGFECRAMSYCGVRNLRDRIKAWRSTFGDGRRSWWSISGAV